MPKWPTRRREVYVFLGDGTYLMMPSEIVTSVQEGVKIIIVLVDNHGFASIGGLSQSVGSGGFGTQYHRRRRQLSRRGLRRKRPQPGRARDRRPSFAELKEALETAKTLDRTTVIVIETEREVRVPGYDSWWDVAVAEVSETSSVRDARDAMSRRARRKGITCDCTYDQTTS